MLLIKRLALINFLSHKTTHLDFRPSHKLLIDGISGAGKSSIVEAIIWVLYGKGRSENKNLIRRGTKEATVTMELVDDNGMYQITRTVGERGRQTLEVEIMNTEGKYEPAEKTGLKDYQNYIEKDLLKCSYTLFVNSVVSPQENTESFIKQTATKKKELLMEMANIEDLDSKYRKAKDMYQLDSELLNRHKGIQATLEEKIKENTAGLTDITQLKNRELQLTQSIESFKKEIEEINKIKNDDTLTRQERINHLSRIDLLRCEKSGNEMDIAHNLKEVESLKKIDIKQINDGLESLELLKTLLKTREEKEKANSDRQNKINQIMNSKPPEYDYDKDIEKVNKQLITIMAKWDTHCSEIQRECPRLMEECRKQTSFFENQLETLVINKQKQEEKLRTYQSLISAVEPIDYPQDNYEAILSIKKQIELCQPLIAMKANYDQNEKRLAQIFSANEKIELKNKEFDIKILESENKIKELELKLSQSNMDQLLTKERDITHRIAQDSSELVCITQEITINKQLTKIIEKDKADLAFIQGAIKGEGEKLECLEMIKEALGAKGIKTIVADYLIPKLENRINEILSKLSDFKVRIETQKTSVDGESIIEGLYIYVKNGQGEEFDFANFSGGQKLKIIVAISEALASLQKVGFRIYDELFVGLDDSSVESFGEIIKTLQDRFSQIFCISHLRVIKDSFEESLLVTIKDGISNVE